VGKNALLLFYVHADADGDGDSVASLIVLVLKPHVCAVHHWRRWVARFPRFNHNASTTVAVVKSSDGQRAKIF